MLVTTASGFSSTNRVLEFDDISAVAKKFPSGGVYNAAVSYFQQEPTPAPLKVGKWFKALQDTDVVGTKTPTLAAVQGLGATGALSLNGVTIPPGDVTSTASRTAAALTIQGQIQGVSGFSAVTVAFDTVTNKFTLGWGNSGNFTSNPTGEVAELFGWDDALVLNGSAAEAVSVGMANIQGESDFTWHVLSKDISLAVDIQAMADWASAARKIFPLVTDSQRSLNPLTILLRQRHSCPLRPVTGSGFNTNPTANTWMSA